MSADKWRLVVGLMVLMGLTVMIIIIYKRKNNTHDDGSNDDDDVYIKRSFYQWYNKPTYQEANTRLP